MATVSGNLVKWHKSKVNLDSVVFQATNGGATRVVGRHDVNQQEGGPG